MIKLTLPGSIRSKKNSKTPIGVPSKTGKASFYKRFPKLGLTPVRIQLIPSKAYKAWEEVARLAARMQLHSMGIIKPLDGPVHVAITVYYKGQRPDLTGCEESVGDCLEGIAWVNDKQIESSGINRIFHDKENPRTCVEITPITVQDEQRKCSSGQKKGHVAAKTIA